MKQNFLLSGFILLLLLFSCSKEYQENFRAEGNEPEHSPPAVEEYRIDSTILIALQKEMVFQNAVSIENQKRIIEKSDLVEGKAVDRTDLLLMKPDDFAYLCKKYDCNVTPYLISELGKTASERLSLMVKNEDLKTKSQVDVIASCQAIKNLVITQTATAYQWARNFNNISTKCNCSTANNYWDVVISNLEFTLMTTFPPEGGEYKLYRKIYQLTLGFQNDMLGMSMADVKEIVNLPNLDILFANLKYEITHWGNSILPYHLTFYVTCKEKCPICHKFNCDCKGGGPHSDSSVGDSGGGNSWGGGVTPATPCEYCGATNCTGECVADIKNIAPKAVRIFNIDRSISLSMWEQMEESINSMFGGDVIIDYLSQALREKISLTLSYNGGCKNVFLTNTISLRTRYSYLEREDFIKSLFHVYQYNYYGEYDMRYAMNLEFEAETYLYLSNCILAGDTTNIAGCPVFDNAEIKTRYQAWAMECIYDFESNRRMGILVSDEDAFLISYTNAAHANDPFAYQDMEVDTSKGMLGAMFDFFLETRKLFDF